MTTPLAHLQTTSKVIKRAQYEAFEFTIVHEGVRVRNASHADPAEHEYIVTVSEGIPTDCECPADANYDGACKHRVAVAIRRPILDAAVDRQLAADGGKPLSSTAQASSIDEPRDSPPESPSQNPPESSPSSSEDDERDPDESSCDCAGFSDGFPCWECVRTGRREL